MNIRAKYSIDDRDIYNFDETGFIIGIISLYTVITAADQKGRTKAIQPSNREWATAIICVSREGRVLPPFLVL